MRNTRTGSIILEHDGGGNRTQTVAALKVVLPRLIDTGYHFVTP
jgi:peptidoglycan-N-acetylglucosamine deacetylase